MRSFGLIGLVVALLIVAWLSTRQLDSVQEALSPVATGDGVAPANVHERSQQLQQQLQQQVNKAAEQSRRELSDDDAK